MITVVFMYTHYVCQRRQQMPCNMKADRFRKLTKNCNKKHLTVREKAWKNEFYFDQGTCCVL